MRVIPQTPAEDAAASPASAAVGGGGGVLGRIARTGQHVKQKFDDMFDFVRDQFDAVREMYKVARGDGKKDDSLELIFKVRGQRDRQPRSAHAHTAAPLSLSCLLKAAKSIREIMKSLRTRAFVARFNVMFAVRPNNKRAEVCQRTARAARHSPAPPVLPSLLQVPGFTIGIDMETYPKKVSARHAGFREAVALVRAALWGEAVRRHRVATIKTSKIVIESTDVLEKQGWDSAQKAHEVPVKMMATLGGALLACVAAAGRQ